MRTESILVLVIVMVSIGLGWIFNSVYSDIHYEETTGDSKILYQPHDRIKQSDIHVTEDRIIIEVKNAQWSYYSDTHSMEPAFGSGSNGLELVPDSEDDLFVGDVVGYEDGNGITAHRITETGYDEIGKYFILKGDNNKSPDSGKVRFSQIRYVLIGVIY